MEGDFIMSKKNDAKEEEITEVVNVRHLESFLRLSEEMRTKMVLGIRELFQNRSDAVEKIVQEIKENPQEWSVSYHSTWGMMIKNHIRENIRVTDAMLPPTLHLDGELYSDMDDYYIGIVEVAVKAGIYNLLKKTDRI